MTLSRTELLLSRMDEIGASLARSGRSPRAPASFSSTRSISWAPGRLSWCPPTRSTGSRRSSRRSARDGSTSSGRR